MAQEIFINNVQLVTEQLALLVFFFTFDVLDRNGFEYYCALNAKVCLKTCTRYRNIVWGIRGTVPSRITDKMEF